MAQGLGDKTLELPKDVVSAAAAFDDYIRSAAAIGGFSDVASVAEGMRRGVAYQPAQLEEGMIAYGAIIALQDQRFVEAVDLAGRGEDGAALAEALIESPDVVFNLDGAQEAGSRIEAALAARATLLMSAGRNVKSAAYSVQLQAWSKTWVSDPQGRLAQVKSLSNVPVSPSTDDQRAMLQEAATPIGVSAQGAQASFGPVEAKALALAAESVLGRAHATDRGRLTPLLTDADSAQCLRLAKLNLYQCMAVAGPQYEDIYCLGQHALMDTSVCVDRAAHPESGLASE
jgi:hypothetical protein